MNPLDNDLSYFESFSIELFSIDLEFGNSLLLPECPILRQLGSHIKTLRDTHHTHLFLLKVLG